MEIWDKIKYLKLQNSEDRKLFANTFKITLRPIFAMMEKDIDIPHPSLLIPAVILDLYKKGTENLKRNVKYVFDNKKLQEDNWRVLTWEKYIKQSNIMKHGTETDIANLPEETQYIKYPIPTDITTGNPKSLIKEPTSINLSSHLAFYLL